ncbi:Filamin-B [Thelohanellus kitauei]|uniref:Filamin-B n=1 Tax=Thelohanellus kitauei TaxID=669202 RepID=A0A0C2N1B8_THEKT|nr:Filamin-B [Thelohanellus kitauei]
MEKSNSFYSIQSNQADDRFSTGWVDIQKNTFTNWCNSTLATKHVAVNDLYTDMCDGVTLIHLYELVSGKTIDHSIQQPKVLPHKLQNISLVMKAMNADGVKFVNIEPLDICDGNPKLILAFIWHMILYYQIGMPQPMSSCSSVDTSKIHPKPSLAEVHPATKSIDEKVYKVSPRTLLLRLVNSLLPHVTVVNLTSDWNDGKALAALIEVLSPGSCPSNEQWNDKNPLLNVTTALCLAEVHLGIPVLIEPHHMTAKNVDELSMITYLSSFTKEGGVAEKYFVKKLSEKFPSISNDLSNMTTNWNNGVLLCKILKECHPQALKDGFITDFSNLEPESHFYIQHSISNINNAFHDAKTLLDIQPNISPELFAAKNVPALAVMSYLSPFLQITPRVVEDPTLASDIGIQLTTQDPDHFPDSRISFRIVSLKHQIPTKDLAIKIEKQGHPRMETGFKTSWLNDKECRVDFTPEDAGVYVLGATLQGQPIKNSPFRLEVLSPHFKSSFVRLENFDPVIDSQEGLEFVVHLKRSIGALSCIIEVFVSHP